MLGREYVIDHCVSRLNLEAEEQLYRTYITDSLKIIMENTARLVKEGKVIPSRYVDILNSMKNPDPQNVVEEQKSADMIISNIKNKLNALGGK